jgi:hypothetical protein
LFFASISSPRISKLSLFDPILINRCFDTTFWMHFDLAINQKVGQGRSISRFWVIMVFDEIRPCPNVNFFTVFPSETSRRSYFEAKIREMGGGESSDALQKAINANLRQLFDGKRSKNLRKQIWRDRQSPARTFKAINIWKRWILAQREK